MLQTEFSSTVTAIIELHEKETRPSECTRSSLHRNHLWRQPLKPINRKVAKRSRTDETTSSRSPSLTQTKMVKFANCVKKRVTRSTSKCEQNKAENDALQHLEVGAMLFNQEPSLGLQYWTSNGILLECEPASVASFLFGLLSDKNQSTGCLSQRSLAEYLGKKHNEAVLKCFLMQIDMRGRSPVEVLLELSSCYLCVSGEAQSILQILDTLALVYVQQNAHEAILKVCYPRDNGLMEKVEQSCFSKYTASDLPLGLSTLFYSILVFHRDIRLAETWRRSGAGGGNSSTGRSLTVNDYMKYVHCCDPHIDDMILHQTFCILQCRDLESLSDHTNQVKALQEQLVGFKQPFNTFHSWKDTVRRIWNRWDALEFKSRKSGKTPPTRVASNSCKPRIVYLLTDWLLVLKPMHQSSSKQQQQQPQQFKVIHQFPLHDIQVAATGTSVASNTALISGPSDQPRSCVQRRLSLRRYSLRMPSIQQVTLQFPNASFVDSFVRKVAATKRILCSFQREMQLF